LGIQDLLDPKGDPTLVVKGPNSTTAAKGGASIFVKFQKLLDFQLILLERVALFLKTELGNPSSNFTLSKAQSILRKIVFYDARAC
jgi:hypothetical protein